MERAELVKSVVKSCRDCNLMHSKRRKATAAIVLDWGAVSFSSTTREKSVLASVSSAVDSPGRHQALLKRWFLASLASLMGLTAATCLWTLKEWVEGQEMTVLIGGNMAVSKQSESGMATGRFEKSVDGCENEQVLGTFTSS